jgi:hypothetical protein
VLEWNPLQVADADLRLQAGLERTSTPEDRQLHDPLASLTTRWDAGPLRLEGDALWRTRQPNFEQRHYFSAGRTNFPNHGLTAETVTMGDLRSTLTWGPFELNAGVRREGIDNWIGSAALRELSSAYDSAARDTIAADTVTSDTLAFGWSNWERADMVRLQLGGAVRLGNWRAELRTYRGATLQVTAPDGERFEARHLPPATYEGNIVWKRALLGRRHLGVQMRWDWEWYGSRRAWEMDPVLHQAYRREYPNWLALDFEARMRILEFELFYRVRNFDHDTWYTDPGYTPAGIQFEYGITWSLKG